MQILQPDPNESLILKEGTDLFSQGLIAAILRYKGMARQLRIDQSRRSETYDREISVYEQQIRNKLLVCRQRADSRAPGRCSRRVSRRKNSLWKRRSRGGTFCLHFNHTTIRENIFQIYEDGEDASVAISAECDTVLAQVITQLRIEEGGDDDDCATQDKENKSPKECFQAENNIPLSRISVLNP